MPSLVAERIQIPPGRADCPLYHLGLTPLTTRLRDSTLPLKAWTAGLVPFQTVAVPGTRTSSTSPGQHALACFMEQNHAKHVSGKKNQQASGAADLLHGLSSSADLEPEPRQARLLVGSYC